VSDFHLMGRSKKAEGPGGELGAVRTSDAAFSWQRQASMRRRTYGVRRPKDLLRGALCVRRGHERLQDRDEQVRE
jgi:hypothetical protein